jgi:hypothetical protein
LPTSEAGDDSKTQDAGLDKGWFVDMAKAKAIATPDLLKERLMLRLREWAALTGTPMASAYKLAAEGKIPGLLRVGNTIRISTAALREQLASGPPVTGGAR